MATFDHAEVVEWAARGRHHELLGHRIFVVDAPATTDELEPLLVVHGFPTSSFDYAHLLDAMSERRRVVLVDLLGYGLSAKPDLHYTMALQADLVVALAAELGLDRVALLTHDMGDTVGGELLARQTEGTWPVEVDAPGGHERQHLHRHGPPHRRPAAAPLPARRAARRRRPRPGGAGRVAGRHPRPGGIGHRHGRARRAGRARRRRGAASPHHPLHRGAPGQRSAGSPAPSRPTRRRSTWCGARSTRSRWRPWRSSSSSVGRTRP